MKTVNTVTSYLESTAPPTARLDPPVVDASMERMIRPSIEAYTEVYRLVGDAYNWVDRLRLPTAELQGIIHDDQVEIYRLHVGDRIGGFCELDCHDTAEIEITYLGLADDFIGLGLGKYLLNWTLHQAFRHGPKRVWLHTCDLDHAAALPNYLKAGMKLYDTKVINQPLEVDLPGDAETS